MNSTINHQQLTNFMTFTKKIFILFNTFFVKMANI